MTELILIHPVNVERVVATEGNEFCLGVLPKNLSRSDDSRLTIVKSPSELAALNFTADMIIGDGGFYSEEELSVAQAGSVVFMEGHRSKLRTLMTESLQRRGLEITFRHFGGPLIPLRLVVSRRFYLPIPLVRRHFGGGCWIGIINAVGVPAASRTAGAGTA